MPMIRLLASSAFDPEATERLGAAFDQAWQVLEAAGSRLADEAHAAATREILAKTVILLGKSGERDVTRLVHGALALLEANSRLAIEPDRLAAGNRSPRLWRRAPESLSAGSKPNSASPTAARAGDPARDEG
ncbi:hypothetical protein [Methyloceanibacter marginalis]|nr:hypothetical protein [Methyloceanibacter marginalis]